MNPDTDNVLRLGRDLADALDPSDVVGRWMSHHLAELINSCEKDPTNDQLAATTREVVLKLWEHKSGARFTREPYAYLRPVLRAIERLDPSPDPWAYYRPFDEQAPSVKAMRTYPLLPIACDIDHEVGHLIRLVIAVTAEDAISCEEPWVADGINTAKTEDRIVRTLEQFIRRHRLRPKSDPDETLAKDCEAAESKDTTPQKARDESSSAAPEDTEVETDGAPDLSEPLTLAIQAAVIRCQALLKRLSDICGQAPEPKGSGAGPARRRTS